LILLIRLHLHLKPIWILLSHLLKLFIISELKILLKLWLLLLIHHKILHLRHKISRTSRKIIHSLTSLKIRLLLLLIRILHIHLILLLLLLLLLLHHHLILLLLKILMIILLFLYFILWLKSQKRFIRH